MSMSIPYLNQAHDFHVQSLTITHQMAVASRAFDHLHENIAVDAVHNSDERCNVPNCYPETRQAVQGEIHSWITDGDNDAEPKTILWLTGPAGGGKTAIAGSIAELCEGEGTLAGSFFFSSFAGSDTRRTKRCLVATLAYCLLQHDGLQQLRTPILSAIERDPSIFRKSLSAQFKALILKPLHDIRQLFVLADLPKVVIIDGLDEVEATNSEDLEPREARLANEAEQVEVLSTLLQAVHSRDFPFRMLVPLASSTREIFLDDKYNPHSDIALFLGAKFGEIRRRYKLPVSWPGEQVLDAFRDNASGQFIYAATIVRFLQSAGMHPQARLECILHTNNAETSKKTIAFLSLDALYTQILSSSPDLISSTRWMGAISSILKGEKARFVRQFLQEYHGQADYLLENLASLISIPAVEDTRSRFNFYHKSLGDSFRDSQRSGPELHKAFIYGTQDFVRARFAQILIAKSPVIPLAECEWADFLVTFLQLLDYSTYGQVSAERQAAWVESLAPCDMAWWVRRVHDAYRGHEPDEERVECIELLFGIAHQWCGDLDYLDYDACKPLCRRWRSDIISGCNASGWCVPNAVAFLRERMQAEASHWEDGGTESGYTIIGTFEPPLGGDDTAQDAGTLLNAPGDTYETTCRLADSLYSQLPETWPELYRKELSEGRTPRNALRREIGRIVEEMGVEIEDYDADDSGPDSDSDNDSDCYDSDRN